jgi:hypothetical protein
MLKARCLKRGSAVFLTVRMGQNPGSYLEQRRALSAANINEVQAEKQV